MAGGASHLLATSPHDPARAEVLTVSLLTASFPICMRHLALFTLLALPVFAATDPAQLDAARALYRDARLDEAKQAFQAIAQSDPANVDAPLHLGWIALRRGDHEAAVAILEPLVQRVPERADCHHALGDAYGLSAQRAGLFSKLGWAKKCKAEYQRAIELAPDNVRYRRSLFEFHRQAPSIAGGGADLALAEANEIKRIDPVQGHLALATLHYAEKKYALALAEYQAVAELEPDQIEHHQRLFEFYRQGPGLALGGLEKAQAEAGAILRLDPVQGRIALAMLHADQKQFDLALEELDQTLAQAPNDYVTLYHVGRLAAISGQYLDRGLAALQQCLQMTPAGNQPGHAAVYWRIGNVEAHRANTAAAREAYQAALRLYPEFRQVAEDLKKLR